MPRITLSLAGAVFAAASLAAPGAAAERWLEIKSEHFRVYTDGSEKDGRKVATGFEQLRRLFKNLGDLRVDPPAPIVGSWPRATRTPCARSCPGTGNAAAAPVPPACSCRAWTNITSCSTWACPPSSATTSSTTNTRTSSPT